MGWMGWKTPLENNYSYSPVQEESEQITQALNNAKDADYTISSVQFPHLHNISIFACVSIEWFVSKIMHIFYC